MMRRLLLLAIPGLLLAAGCKHKCCLNDPDKRPNPYRPPAPNSPFLLPPANLPTTPGPGGPPPGSIVPPVGPGVPVDPRNYPPPSLFNNPNPTLQPPVRPAPEVILPDPIPGASSRSAYPGNPAPGALGAPAKPTVEPPVKAAPSTTGLSNFVRVKDGIAAGRKPSLEGFDSLKQAGYRTAVYLHPAGADVGAARDVAEKRGLRFVAIETTPEKLADALGVFNSAVADRAHRPAYVYDDDGVRAGALWYLHFRTVEAMNDDAARVRAKPLGLTEQGDEAKEFAIATQRYLETR